eukprot:TRINITY_DN41635_c0_g1_i1.p1 TRINITY_DN41635_c0_g1~~TRINITY_DN41635_c0_g1_i1.p1  ORF type:complete len:258 (-),score=23.05 TRINITY_DN41635_c0_g1_i1:301-1074(-)
MEAFATLNLLHNQLLHGLSDRRPVFEFEGISQASRQHKTPRLLEPSLANKVSNVDLAYNVVRHMRTATADGFLHMVLSNIDTAGNVKAVKEDKSKTLVASYAPLASHLAAEPEKEPTIVGRCLGGALDISSEGTAQETLRYVQTNISFSDCFTAEEQVCGRDTSMLRQALERDVAVKVARDQIKESVEFMEPLIAAPEDDHRIQFAQRTAEPIIVHRVSQFRDQLALAKDASGLDGLVFSPRLRVWWMPLYRRWPKA